MQETIITVNGENIATIFFVGLVGFALLRIVTLWLAKSNA